MIRILMSLNRAIDKVVLFNLFLQHFLPFILNTNLNYSNFMSSLNSKIPFSYSPAFVLYVTSFHLTFTSSTYPFYLGHPFSSNFGNQLFLSLLCLYLLFFTLKNNVITLLVIIYNFKFYCWHHHHSIKFVTKILT